jgi:hypothetical protein
MDSQAVIDHTRRWIDAFVLGLNLCPFARRVFQEDRIRYALSNARDEMALAADLRRELTALAEPPIERVETTLLIHPNVLPDFLAYNDFLDTADRLLRALALEGVIQIASFHPAYQFAGTDPDAVENYTNRSPYPMLHLLREASFAAAEPDELLAIPRRNIETMKGLGTAKVLEMLRALEGRR